MKKTLLGLVLSTFILVPTFAQAKMLKIGEDWINETAIIGLKQANGKEAGCSIIYSLANRFTTETVKGSCEDFIKEKEIDSK